MGKKGHDPQGGGSSMNKKKKLRLDGLVKVQVVGKKKAAAAPAVEDVVLVEPSAMSSMSNAVVKECMMGTTGMAVLTDGETSKVSSLSKGKQVMHLVSAPDGGCNGRSVEPGMVVGPGHEPSRPLEHLQTEGTQAEYSQETAHQVLDDLPQRHSGTGHSSSQSRTLGEQDSYSRQSLSNMESSKPAVPTPWVSLFKDNRDPTKGLKLAKYEGPKHARDGMVELQAEDVDDVEKAWGICLIGFVVGKFPGIKAIVEVCKSWKVPYKYFLHASGWIVFKFEEEAHRDLVLANGPYVSYGRPWLLKRMPQFFDFNKDGFSSIPTWITLPDLPLECWNDRALAIIGSRIGDPVTTDRLTAEKARLSYARMLVEVDFTKALTRVVSIKLPNGKVHEQPVCYEKELKWCTKCSKFGHNIELCRVEEQQGKVGEKTHKWVKKDRRIEDEANEVIGGLNHGKVDALQQDTRVQRIVEGLLDAQLGTDDLEAGPSTSLLQSVAVLNTKHVGDGLPKADGLEAGPSREAPPLVAAKMDTDVRKHAKMKEKRKKGGGHEGPRPPT